MITELKEGKMLYVTSGTLKGEEVEYRLPNTELDNHHWCIYGKNHFLPGHKTNHCQRECKQLSFSINQLSDIHPNDQPQ